MQPLSVLFELLCYKMCCFCCLVLTASFYCSNEAGLGAWESWPRPSRKLQPHRKFSFWKLFCKFDGEQQTNICKRVDSSQLMLMADFRNACSDPKFPAQLLKYQHICSAAVICDMAAGRWKLKKKFHVWLSLWIESLLFSWLMSLIPQYEYQLMKSDGPC